MASPTAPLSPQAQKILMKAYQLRNEGKIDASLKQARAVAQKHGSNLHVVYLLGSLYLEKKDIQKAITFFKKGITADPKGHICQGGLGACYYRSGQLDQARLLLEEAHKKAPNEFSHISNLANVAFDQEDWVTAERLLLLIFNNQPTNHDVATKLNILFVNQGRYDQALFILKTHADKCPNDIPALLALALFYEYRSMVEECKDLNTRILKLEPDNVRAIFIDYHINIQNGDKQNAILLLKKIKKLDPDNINLFGAAVSLKSEAEIFGESLDEQYKTVVNLAEDDLKLTTLQPSSLYHLANILDHMQKYDLAFKIYMLANNKKKEKLAGFGQNFDREILTSYIKKIKAYENWPALLSKSPVNDQRMVFILALPRSGTTLLEQILAAHPHCDSIGESDFPDLLRYKLANQNLGLLPDINLTENLENVSLETVQLLTSKFLNAAESQLTNKAALKIIEKSVSTYLHAGLLASIFPNAKFIYCKRNRAAAGLSIFQQDFAAQFLYDLDLNDINFMFDLLEEIMNFWQTLFGERILTIQYEDLVIDTENKAKEVTDFIGLDWDPACLAYHKNKRVIKTASLNQARQRVYTSSTDRYKNYEDYLGPLQVINF